MSCRVDQSLRITLRKRSRSLFRLVTEIPCLLFSQGFVYIGSLLKEAKGPIGQGGQGGQGRQEARAAGGKHPGGQDGPGQPGEKAHRSGTTNPML